jgi:hypothetical protein
MHGIHSSEFGESRRLEALERRFDGPIPEAERSLLRHASVTAMARLQAATEAAFFAVLVRRQIDAIRRRGGAGSPASELLDDLASYRRQRRA